MNRSNKKIAVVIAIMILTLSIASTGFATNAMERLEAYYKNITIFKNGIQATFTHEPFIVDGTTYVPVRDMSQLLGKTVSFNPTTYRIDIADVADANTIALQNKVVQHEITIKNLESQIATLKGQLDDKDEVSDLGDLEDYLNDELYEYKDVEFQIVLDGDEDDIEIEIYVDLNDYSTEWYKLTNTQIKSYIQSIVDEVEDEFEDAAIEGFIEDSDEDEELVSFNVKSTGALVVVYEDDDYSSIDTIEELEVELNDEFSSYGGVYFDIEVYGDEDDVELDILALDDELVDLEDYEIEDYLEDIYNFIMSELDSDSIVGEIYDDVYSYDFYFTTSGSAKLN